MEVVGGISSSYLADQTPDNWHELHVRLPRLRVLSHETLERLDETVIDGVAVVQTVDRRTFRHSDPVWRAELGARMNALSTAQAIVTESEARVATMADVITSALVPHGADGAIDDRIRLAGPEIALEGRRAHVLALALRELAASTAR